MTINECYQALGGNYDNVLTRFRSEERIQKYIYKFLEDTSFINMQTALENGQIEEAFRAAHTLRGVSENLGLDKLSNSSYLITEALRSGNDVLASTLFPQVKEDYQLTMDAIKCYQEDSK